MTTGKTIALTRWTFVGKVMSLLFNVLSRLVITFLPRSKCLLISWLQSPSAVILETEKKKKVCHCFHSLVMGPDAMILVFWMLSFNPTFSLSSFTFIKRLFSSSSLSAISVVSSAYLRLLIFHWLPQGNLESHGRGSQKGMVLWACDSSREGCWRVAMTWLQVGSFLWGYEQVLPLWLFLHDSRYIWE